MKNDWLVISFHTPDTLYSGHAKECIKTLQRFGIPHDIREVQPVGDWVVNCAYKPRFILQMLKEYHGRPLVWLDVDARVLKYPALFDTLDAGFAVHYRAGTELLSNTMFFANGEAGCVGDGNRRLVEQWISEQSANPREWDQKTLQRAIAKNGIEPYMLPPEYAAIDFMRVKDAVIIQTQASRTVRRAARAKKAGRHEQAYRAGR